MDDRFNTAAGWTLFAGIVALGLSSVSSRVYDMHRPHEMGYPIKVAGGGDAEDTGPDLGTLLATADVAAGAKEAAGRCGTCHTFESGGAMGQGPNLYGTMGKAVGGHAGFSYSSAVKEHGGTWTWEDMNEWILAPKKHIPGTAMGFAGLKNDQARANIMVYLNSLGSNLPLPAPKAAEEPAADDAAADGGEDATAKDGEDSAVETAAEAASAE